MDFSATHGTRRLRDLAGANIELHCTWEMSLQAWHVNTTFVGDRRCESSFMTG